MRDRDMKMLAVRLDPELVCDIRAYANGAGIPIRKVVEECISLGLARSPQKGKSKPEEPDHATRKKLFAEYTAAKKMGKVLPWKSRKMLAVRLPPNLLTALRDYATTEKENIIVITEWFLRTGLALKKGEEVNLDTPSKIPHVAFRKRRYDGC